MGASRAGRPAWRCCAWLLASAVARSHPGAAGAAVTGVRNQPDEQTAIEVLKAPGFSPSSIDAADVDWLVHRGWHEVVRTLVQLSHSLGEEHSQRVATQVRQAVQAEKNRLDDLIRALDRNYGKAAEVNPAVQWAQNSTHAFLAVKFAQRWNAPGALEVENETVAITSCCFNFTAFGEHSFIKRRYHLSFEFLRPLVPEASSWSLASVGRMTVTLAKQQAANWPRLLATAAPKNLGVWRDMKEKWQSELQKFPQLPETGSAPSPPKQKAAKANVKKAKAEDEEDGEEARAFDRELELVSDCPKSSYAGTAVAELCGPAWGEVVERPQVRGRRWLVKLYSSQGDGNTQAMKKLMPVWKRLADVFPSMVPGGRVGALDCGHDVDHWELCRKLGATKASLPMVQRFAAGERGEAWSGDLGASIEAFAEFGAGRSEL